MIIFTHHFFLIHFCICMLTFFSFNTQLNLNRDRGGRSPEDRDRRRSVEKGEKAEDSSVADSLPPFNDGDNNKKKGANEKGWF